MHPFFTILKYNFGPMIREFSAIKVESNLARSTVVKRHECSSIKHKASLLLLQSKMVERFSG